MTYFILLSICIVVILFAILANGFMTGEVPVILTSVALLIGYVFGVMLLYGLNKGSVEIETAEIINESRTKTYVAFQIETKRSLYSYSNKNTGVRSGSSPNKIYVYDDLKLVSNPFEVKVYHFINCYGFHTSSKIKLELTKDKLKKEN